MPSGKYKKSKTHIKKWRDGYLKYLKENGHPQKNKTYEEIYGIEGAKIQKKKMSLGNKNKVRSEETKQKISLSKRGKKLSTCHKKQISKSLKGRKITWGDKIGKANSISQIGNKHSEKTKRKMRISTFKYIQQNCDILYPRIGHNEKEILDTIEQELNTKIIRQYKCEGYFIDGYIPKINVAIEIDEKPKIKQKDIEREQNIKNNLNCKLMRIKDYV